MSIDIPQELLSYICACVCWSALPPNEPSLDPLIVNGRGVPSVLPSSWPPANWSENVARHTLANLCLVNKSWYEAAKPFLWRRIEVRLPRSWLAFVEQIAPESTSETEENDPSVLFMSAMQTTVQHAANALVSAGPASVTWNVKESPQELQERILSTLHDHGPETAIPLELLSPPASRDPSPRRLRAKSKSPVRWKLMRSLSDALQGALDQYNPGVYVPAVVDANPGRYVQHLDFTHFRTIGMRRSVEEGVNSRFVTGDRVHAVLKEMPNLMAFGATEYMDGALTLPVLEELLLRGTPSRGRGRSSHERGRRPAMCEGESDVDDDEEDDQERRRDCRDLEAVDFTGCISAVFVNALNTFVQKHLVSPSDGDIDDDHRQPQLFLPGIQRLSLRGVKSVPPLTLNPFILSLPSLTHLDLSGTRVSSALLMSLAESTTMRLKSLALARCPRLTGDDIVHFLTSTPVTASLTELNLYNDQMYVSPLSSDDLARIFARAPCFASGKLVYLDLSNAPLTTDLLRTSCPPQPSLRSLGLSFIPDLPLPAIADFLRTKAPNVEVLTLIATSPELECGVRVGPGPFPPVTLRGSPRQASVALHAQFIQPLCTKPFSLMGAAAAPPPTRLRVIELSMQLLTSLGAGAGSWRIVKSKGGRGWYVDTAAGWVATCGAGGGRDHVLDSYDDSATAHVLSRDLEKGHPLRDELERLADANGNVSSGVGWHARKMEVLRGDGLLGREDGLYGAVSFAYSG